MKWRQFLDIKPDGESTGQVQTDIECPSCGRHIYLNKTIILTSYPSKYAYWCSCGWSGYAPIRWAKDGDLASNCDCCLINPDKEQAERRKE